MNKINISLIVFLLYTHFLYAQVGINTSVPQATLDVNGNLQIRKDIKLGGVEGIPGSSGASGSSLFTSQGPGKSPVWGTAASGSQTFAITQSIATSDEVGLSLAYDFGYTNMTEYPENMELNTSTDWVEIPGLATTISPSRAINKVVFNLQTVVQSSSMSAYMDIEVAAGIFIDGKLKSTRPVHLAGDRLTFVVLTLFDAISNLPPKTDGTAYNVQVAVNTRYLNYSSVTEYSDGPYVPVARDKIVLIGTYNSYTSNTNAMMNRTSFKIDVFEDMTQNPVIN